MSANFVLRDAGAPTDPDSNLDFRWENTLNAPLVSAALSGDGREIADVYTLTFTVSGSVTVTVECDTGKKNPYRDVTVGKAVVADGSTVNTEIIPGVDLVVSASVATGWQAKVALGGLMNTSGDVTDRLNFGTVEVGTTTTGFRVAAVNVGSDSGTNVTVKALPGGWYEGDTQFIERIEPHSSDAREGLAVAGDYSITFQNWADGTGDNLGYKVADIYVDGTLAVATARFDGSTVYEYGDGHGYDDAADKLRGLQIVLPLTTADPSAATVTLHVLDGSDWIELADDASGSPGTYGSGPVTLTESGQPTGTITASGIAYFWARLNMPSAASIGPLRCMRLSVKGLTV